MRLAERAAKDAELLYLKVDYPPTQAVPGLTLTIITRGVFSRALDPWS